jgi:acyl carrier protein
MTTLDDFLAFVGDRLGLTVTAEDAARDLNQLPGWDSMHLLWLLTALEGETGRRLSVPDVLGATSLEQIYAAVSAG